MLKYQHEVEFALFMVNFIQKNTRKKYLEHSEMRVVYIAFHVYYHYVLVKLMNLCICYVDRI